MCAPLCLPFRNEMRRKVARSHGVAVQPSILQGPGCLRPVFRLPAVMVKLPKMKTKLFVLRSRIHAPAAEVYAWHARPEALGLLLPPGGDVKIVETTGGIERGARVVLRMGRWPFRRLWVAEHGDFEPGRFFSDVQVSGPFACWKHIHSFEPDGPEASILEDRVEYALPGGLLGRWVAGWYVRRKITEMFQLRHAMTKLQLEGMTEPDPENQKRM